MKMHCVIKMFRLHPPTKEKSTGFENYKRVRGKLIIYSIKTGMQNCQNKKKIYFLNRGEDFKRQNCALCA